MKTLFTSFRMICKIYTYCHVLQLIILDHKYTFFLWEMLNLKAKKKEKKNKMQLLGIFIKIGN